MLANHRRQLESVQLWHTHVDENDGNIVFQKAFKGFPCGGRLDQIFSELLQNYLIGEQLCRLIVHQEDVDRVIRDHDLTRFSAVTSAARKGAVRY